ncbi:hypothetical protein O6H91_19G002800 [Diphasiastrum complanatum]|uniref:Uncharacterized protein n=1 Tax=Diphasiastrum complanatum TaxID=34168 RepID=A0ACC2ASB5_DIPCM|nr:hypothetical protein O6H91_19G002800 [Diphasiastrum complanatum]
MLDTRFQAAYLQPTSTLPCSSAFATSLCSASPSVFLDKHKFSNYVKPWVSNTARLPDCTVRFPQHGNAKRLQICFISLSEQPSSSQPAEQNNVKSESKIRVEGLTRTAANGLPILHGVSLRVKAGGVHGLIGPSGSGKSTVLRALNRLWEPPPGTVFIDGVDCTKMDVVSLRRHVGMVFQSACLFDGLVAYNVRYGPSLRGIHLSDERVEELLLKAGISEPDKNFLSKSVNELSGGEAQRVSLARSLANEPEVLLLDEPTSSLDPLSTRIVESTVLELQAEGLTVVLVSHNMDQVNRIANTATILLKGSVLQTGSLEELKATDNAVVQQFITGHMD